MNLKLTLFSQEVEDFVLEIKIASEAKFLDLHNLILKDCGYREMSGQTFLICNEDWRVESRVKLFDNGDTGYDEDLYTMSTCKLSEFLDDEGQRMAYVFNPEEKGIFLIEVTEISFEKTPFETAVSRRHGKAPSQGEQEEDSVPQQKPSNEETEMEEDFYGTEGFEDEELDMEGFEIDE